MNDGQNEATFSIYLSFCSLISVFKLEGRVSWNDQLLLKHVYVSRIKLMMLDKFGENHSRLTCRMT